MKFISWNVNGLRACVNKGFLDSFYQLDADFFCLQETKLQEGQIDLDLPGYHQYWCYAQKKGYSGTAIFTKHTPLSVSYGLGVEELDTEGRLITLEYREFYLVTCYTPNAQRGLARIEHRLNWEQALQDYLIRLDAKKPVIYCGDLNVAHKEIDLKNPGSNRGNAGFSDEERNAFSQLLDKGFTDSFRHLYPDVTGAYSWWSYMFNARQNNAGWRIDYFVVSNRLTDRIFDATIHPDIQGSDHCPVGLDLNVTCNGSIWSPETQKPVNAEGADKESPVGAFSFLVKCSLSLVAAIVLIGAVLYIRDRPTIPDENQPTTNAPYSDLIGDVRYPDGELELVDGSSGYFRCGLEIWQPVEPLVNLDSFERKPTFWAVVHFSEDTSFTADKLPELQYRNRFGDMYFHEPYLTHQFFYGANNSVAGFLLLGDVPQNISTSLTVRYANQIATRDLLITAPQDDTDYSQYTTSRLVNVLGTNHNLSRLQPYTLASSFVDFEPVHYDLDYFMKHNAAARELVCRTDAVDAIFDALEVPSLSAIDPTGNLLLLLDYDLLQAQMSAKQADTYQKLKDARKPAYEELPVRGEIIWYYG